MPGLEEMEHRPLMTINNKRGRDTMEGTGGEKRERSRRGGKNQGSRTNAGL